MSGGLSSDALRSLMLPQIRYNMKMMLTPLFGTAEQRQAASDRIDTLTDEQVETAWTRYVEAEDRQCAECGRPYDDE